MLLFISSSITCVLLPNILYPHPQPFSHPEKQLFSQDVKKLEAGVEVLGGK